jgi:hypothetical protein
VRWGRNRIKPIRVGSRLAVEFRAIVNAHPRDPGHVVLKVRCFEARRFGDRLHRGGPVPARLEDGAADGGTAGSDQLQSPARKLAHFLGRSEVLQLGSRHCRDYVGHSRLL